MPGFNDAHMHLTNAGFKKLTVDLTGTKSLEEFRERIRKRVETAGPMEWITGSGWDESLWQVKELPSRWDIDEVTTDHPVYMERIDGHVAVANTLALKLSRVTLASKDPEGGEISRDATGQPDGILRETAKEMVKRSIPSPTPDKRRQAIEAALQDIARSGVTSVQDNSDSENGEAYWDDFEIFEATGTRRQVDGPHFRMDSLHRAAGNLEAAARRSSADRQHAAHRNAEGLPGWIAGIAHRGPAAALCRRSVKLWHCLAFDQTTLNQMTHGSPGCRLPDWVSRHRRQSGPDGTGCVRRGRESGACQGDQGARWDGELSPAHRTCTGYESAAGGAVPRAENCCVHAAEPSADATCAGRWRGWDRRGRRIPTPGRSF